MGFKCRKPKTQSRPLFFLPLFMRSPFLISQSMASCRDPEATTRKSVLAPVSPKQDRTGQEKIIRVLSWSYKERNSVEWKRCSENAGNLSWPLKNLMHKNSGKRKLEKLCEIVNVQWNSALWLVNSLILMELFMSACMRACVRRMRSRREPLHMQDGSLKRVGWHHWHRSSTPASAENQLFSQRYSYCLCLDLGRWPFVQSWCGVSSTQALHSK